VSILDRLSDDLDYPVTGSLLAWSVVRAVAILVLLGLAMSLADVRP
jgi:hypothetical protein